MAQWHFALVAALGVAACRPKTEVASSEVKEIEAPKPGDLFCPGTMILDADTRQCSDGQNVQGPFSDRMVELCRMAGYEGMCDQKIWSYAAVKATRGTGVCPNGATPRDGFCSEGDDVFGPFSKDMVDSCVEQMGGSKLACFTNRWSRAFAMGLYGPRPLGGGLGRPGTQPAGRTFPFTHAPKLPYPGGYFCTPTTGDCAFGAPRDGGARKHAGVDLYAPPGTPVYAVDDGTVLYVGDFYEGTWAIEVVHSDFLARYGEVKPNVVVRNGQGVKKGQLLGYVGVLDGISDRAMVHFEAYADETRRDALTVPGSAPYMRRSDLHNPTNWILDWMTRPAQPIQ